MKILFISRLFSPHLGGVEKHVSEVSKTLISKRQNVTVLTEKYDKSLKNNETIDGIKVVRFSYSHIKFLGLLNIWLQIFKHRNLIKDADVIHIHDIYIWYLPFRFLYPFKKTLITIHGFEPDNPNSTISVWQKRLAIKLANASIGVGKYLENYFKIRFDLITYGAITPQLPNKKKIKNSIIFLGRLEKDTALEVFLNWVKKNPKFKVEFCGDGTLRKDCEKFGKVHGFIKYPYNLVEKFEYCFPGGYLSALEALNAGCKLKFFWHNKLREEIWKGTPFVKPKAIEWARKQTWTKLANEYLDLYNSI